MTDKDIISSAPEINAEGDVTVAAGDINHVKITNVTAVFELISARPGITRNEIADTTGLSLMTVSKIIDTFAKKGVITQEKNLKNSAAGRKASLLYVDYSNSYVIVDLSSYNFTACIHTVKKEKVAKLVHVYDKNHDFTENMRRFIFKCKNMLNSYADTNRVIALGVSLPGPYDSVTDKVTNKRMPELNTISITKMLEFGLGIPVTFIDENVKLSIYAHMQTIPDYTKKQLLYLHIGEGVGGGLAINGHIIRGDNQLAGDMGQLIFNEKGRTLEQIIKEPESDTELKNTLKMFFYNAIWFYDPDIFIIEYDRSLNPHISKELIEELNIPDNLHPLMRRTPEFIITDEIKKSHLGLGGYICHQWFKRVLTLPNKI